MDWGDELCMRPCLAHSDNFLLETAQSITQLQAILMWALEKWYLFRYVSIIFTVRRVRKCYRHALSWSMSGNNYFMAADHRIFITLRPRQNGRHFADDIFKCIFLTKILGSQLTIFQHWFRKWLGADQATSRCLNQWWLVYWRIHVSLGLNELYIVT